MTNTIDGTRVAFLIANEGVEQVELQAPWEALAAAGARPVLVAPDSGTAQAFHHLDKGDEITVDTAVAEADPASFGALVLPGGVANPDQLRQRPEAVHFARAFFDAGKPVAVICHGPWTLIDAGVVRGRRITSWPSLKTDLTNAGAEWVDEEVCVDTNQVNTLISSRKPDDLPAFNEQLLKALGVDA